MHSRTANRIAALAACTAEASASIAIAACASALPVDAGDTIVLQFCPAGEFRPSDGREMQVPAWRINAALAARVIDRFNARKTPPVCDYEHQTLRKEENGQPAPAAGWFRALEWREGQGLYATVELTERARQHIAAREYQFFSPVFSFDRVTGDVLSVEMGALTNHPAIDGMEPLALRAAATFGLLPANPQESTVNPLLIAVLGALGLAASTTEQQAIAALSSVKPQLDQLGALRKALGVPDDAAPDTAIATCTALRAKADAPDPAKFVPASVVEQLKTDLAVLTAKTRDREVGELVEGALADGRLLPAQKEWAESLGKSNVAALTAYLAATPPIAALTGTQTGGRQPAATATGEHGLTAAELAVCSNTGITPEAFAKAKAAA